MGTTSLDSTFEHTVRLHSCTKEPDTVEWIETYLKEGDILYDVGANVGAYSLVASKFFNEKVKVYAFEPAFLNFTQLCKNLVLNDCLGAVVPFQVALSDETGISQFNYYNLTPGGAVHALGEAVDYRGQEFAPVATQPMLSYSLDDFIQQFHIPAPNHMKIDVDGTEFSILKGMDQILGEPSMRTLMIEVNEEKGDTESIVEYLAGKGFVDHSQLARNHLFARTT